MSSKLYGHSVARPHITYPEKTELDQMVETDEQY